MSYRAFLAFESNVQPRILRGILMMRNESWIHRRNIDTCIIYIYTITDCAYIYIVVTLNCWPCWPF